MKRAIDHAKESFETIVNIGNIPNEEAYRFLIMVQEIAETCLEIIETEEAVKA